MTGITSKQVYPQPYREWTAGECNNVQGFMENKGQVRDQSGKEQPDIRYVFSGKNFKLILKGDGFSYEIYKSERQEKISEATGDFELNNEGSIANEPSEKVMVQRFDASFINPSDQLQVKAENVSTDFFNYYRGKQPDSITRVHSYSRIYYRNIYPDIDLVFIAPLHDGDALKYEYIVHPGGNVKDIVMQYNSSHEILLKEGELILPGSFGEVREKNLFTYQEDNSHPVASSFQLKGNRISFDVAAYDHRLPLVIDPDIVWATYYGEDATEDKPSELSADEEGNILVIGNTASPVNFVTTGAYQSTYGGADYDAFVLKFNPAGERVWCTYFGGSGSEDGTSIYCDASSGVFAAGATSSADCPMYNAFQPVFGGIKDAFILALDKDGLIKWASYYGGAQPDVIAALDGDAGGNIYFTGWTQSTINISTTNSHQPVKGAMMDAFLTKFDGNGMRIWSTYYGGSDVDRGHSVAIDLDNNVIMTGTTPSLTDIATPGSYQPACGGLEDIFCVKFNAAGERLWGTYFGGENNDKGRAVVTDAAGIIYFTGFTTSENNISTPGSWQPQWSSGYQGNKSLPDAFFTKMNPEGTALIYSTYIGGNNEDYGINIRVKPDGAVLVAGSAYSTGLGTNGVWQQENAGTQDAFIAKFKPDGAIEWFTYYGGPEYERGNGMDVTADDCIYLSGNTVSFSGIATPGAYKETLLDSVDDGMIVKLVDHCTDNYEINNSKKKATSITIPEATGSLFINAQINYAKDKDFFSFENTAFTPNIKLSLTSLPANYNLYLLNAAGEQLASSKKSGLISEEIIFNTGMVGTYLAKVTAANSTAFNDHVCYNLNFSLSSSPFRNEFPEEEGWSTSHLWELYPCPASGSVNIDFEEWDYDLTGLTVYDLFGHVIYREMITHSESYQFDVSGWPNGCYLVQLVSEDKSSSRMLSVVH
ncbi:MAG TPA: SBBP repeat-containing protein [Chitinophagales bacterium]|nr:SBBP repeat-containing protein [Chitinophagales bacterium]